VIEQVTYTSYEAARILQVDESTIRRRCMAGKMVGAFRAVIRQREIWVIPAEALGLGGGEGGNTVDAGQDSAD